ncbi:MAG: hypothetical protein LBI72_00540 [Flavobacteriaceae bacterium]|nr:hypothetical protein [Flavobacteriaceae bacterium]
MDTEVSQPIKQKKEKQHTTENAKEFIEGALYYKLTVSDKKVNDFIQYGVEDPVQLTALLEKYKRKTSVETVTYLQDFLRIILVFGHYMDSFHL